EYDVTPAEAKRLLEGVARRLGVDSTNVFGAYEDTWYFLWRERKLRVNVDPHASRLADPAERERLRRVFDGGLAHVVGYGLPIARTHAGHPRWRSSPWVLSSGRCYLVPGDSPLGWRLPLDSQPWVA